MSRAPVLPLALLVGAVLCGCAVGQPRPEAVHTSAQCPLRERSDGAEVRIVQDAVQAQSAFTVEPTSLFGRAIDWNDEHVVVCSLGRQSTLGVSVKLRGPLMPVREQQLDLPVQVARPAPGSLTAMALSWPCVIAAVPRKGWTRVRAVDAHGEVLASAALER